MTRSPNHKNPTPRTTPGVLVAIFDTGTLIRGASGVGKSTLALGLLDRGHKLIADDAVEVTLISGGKLVGRAPNLLRGFLEVRSLGILDVDALFGTKALAESHTVDFGIQLRAGALASSPRHDEAENRIQTRWSRRTLCGARIPEIVLSADAGHHLPLLVETAVRERALRDSGYNGAARLQSHQRRLAKQGLS